MAESEIKCKCGAKMVYDEMRDPEGFELECPKGCSDDSALFDVAVHDEIEVLTDHADALICAGERLSDFGRSLLLREDGSVGDYDFPDGFEFPIIRKPFPSTKVAEGNVGIRPSTAPCFLTLPALLDPTVCAQRLRDLRAAAGLSQVRAAERASISQSALEKYESLTDPHLPNTRQLGKLATCYGVSVDYLLGADD